MRRRATRPGGEADGHFLRHIRAAVDPRHLYVRFSDAERFESVLEGELFGSRVQLSPVDGLIADGDRHRCINCAVNRTPEIHVRLGHEQDGGRNADQDQENQRRPQGNASGQKLLCQAAALEAVPTDSRGARRRGGIVTPARRSRSDQWWTPFAGIASCLPATTACCVTARRL